MSKGIVIGIAVGMVFGCVASGALAALAAANGVELPMPVQFGVLGACFALVGGFLGMFFSGRSKVRFATPPQRAAALEFRPDPARGAVYVIRDQLFGFAAGWDVLVNGNRLTQTRGQTFVRLDLPPGPVALATRHSSAKQHYNEQQLELVPGAVLFFRLNMAGKGSLEPLDEMRARKLARGCRLIRIDPKHEPVAG